MMRAAARHHGRTSFGVALLLTLSEYPLYPRAFSTSSTTPKKYSMQARADHWMQRRVRREDRIAILQESEANLSEPEQKELNGLLKKNFVEQYSSAEFSAEHVAFKDSHNHIFQKLCLYCQAMRKETDDDINIFYLDGPCAGTTNVLSSLSTDAIDVAQQCYTANRHETTCKALLDQTDLVHVAHCSAKDALISGSGVFGDVDFNAYYFDGCGGYVPFLVEMMEAALVGRRHLRPPIAIGFSILGGGRDCVDKEQDVIRSLVQMVKPMGFRVDHVGDDPGLYGIDDDMKKVESACLTSWCMIVDR